MIAGDSFQRRLMPRWLVLPLQAAVSVGLLALLVSFVDWRAMEDAVQALPGKTLVIVTLVCIAAQASLVLRWRALIEVLGVREHWARSWHSVFGGLFLINFLPGTLGSDGLRIVLLARSCGRASTAVGAVAYERLMQLAIYMVVAAGAAIVPTAGLPAWLRLAVVLCGGAGVVAVIVVLYWLGNRPVEEERKREGLIRAAWDLVARILVETGRMQTKMRRHRIAAWTFWAANVFNVAALIAIVEILLLDRGTSPGLAMVALAASAATVLCSVPISVNGVGIYEATLTWLLSSAGVPTTDAIFAAFMMRLLVMAVSLIGWPSLLILRAAVPGARGPLR